MTPDDIRSAIMTTIYSNCSTMCTICWPNVAFVAPQAPWIRPIIKMGETIIGELGETGIGMRVGLLMISVFGLAGTGTKTILGYAARLEAIFRKKEISGIVFNEPNTDIPGLDDSGYYHVLVSVDFTTWVGE